jgi:hypothetical protein
VGWAQGYYRAADDEPARFVLRRKQELVADRVEYVLEEPIRYVHWDGRSWIVPDPRLPLGSVGFTTDLASIPGFAAWLVPKDGRHTPAAIVHDAMILGPGDRKEYQGIPDDSVVAAADADEIFRAGLHYLGVPLVRRWLMWAAVSIHTLAVGRRPLDLLRLVAVALLLLFGALAVPDAFDVPGVVELPGSCVLRWEAPGLAESSPTGELARLLGLVAMAAAVHAAVWLRRWRFGLVAGLALPLVAFPLLVPALGYALYLALEHTVALALVLARRFGLSDEPVVAPLATRRLEGPVQGQAEGRQ